MCEANLGCDVEVLMLLQQFLCVVDTRAGGGVCGQVKLSSVMDPLQSLCVIKKGFYCHASKMYLFLLKMNCVFVCVMYLFGAAFKHHILLTLVQPSFPHGPEVENTILSL